MSAVIARLIASVVLMLSIPVLFTLLSFLAVRFEPIRSRVLLVGIVTLVCAVAAIVGWVGLWYSQIRWTSARVVGTGVLALGLALLAGIIGSMLAATIPHDGATFGMVFGGMLWGLGWFGLTPILWKETRAERSERLQELRGEQGLACPVCNYNLAGLREARCPECGAAYTLDQLYAAMTEDRTAVHAPVAGPDQRAASDSPSEPTPTSSD